MLGRYRRSWWITISNFTIFTGFSDQSQMIVINVKGGLGNQLFQAAMGVIIANETGRRVCYFTDSYRNYSYGHKFLLNEWSEGSFAPIVDRGALASNFTAVREPEDPSHPYHIREQVIKLCLERENIFLDGYWIRDGYLQGYESLLKDRLAPSANIIPNPKSLPDQLKGAYIGVHVRRSEYGHHGLARMWYYEKCINTIRSQFGNLPVCVFTDEPNFCSFTFRDVSSVYVHTGDFVNPQSDFYLLSAAKHFVLSNSTFSFWAAFLGQSCESEVYFPHPYCVFASNSVLTANSFKWHVIEGAVTGP